MEGIIKLYAKWGIKPGRIAALINLLSNMLDITVQVPQRGCPFLEQVLRNYQDSVTVEITKSGSVFPTERQGGGLREEY